RVLPIGGLKEKILAAKRAGLMEVILPKKNEKDLDEIPKNIRKDMQFHLVDTMDDVLPIALKGLKPRAVKKQKTKKKVAAAAKVAVSKKTKKVVKKSSEKKTRR
ncbi:MAG TPA: S16 family serine protease, partial [Nitrospirota bacterium]